MIYMKQSRQENIIYLIVWGMLFAVPLLSCYVRMFADSEAAFQWYEVLFVWRHFSIYLFLFVVHNFLLAPLLIHNRRRILYFTIVAIVVALFAVYQYNTKPKMKLHEPERHEMRDVMRGEHWKGPRNHEFRRPPLVNERNIMSMTVVILMFGANLGVKEFIRSRDDRRRLAELERQNLEHQLAYLRYQISPHFFMNTLNNIHALIDIDPEKAQETIVELSKMMRYVLYDADKERVALNKELNFIETYIKLMRLRYTDKVRISLTLPADVPDRQLPPLMLISFVENAFKHGVSYQHDSFIEVSMTVADNKFTFRCRNSKAKTPSQEKGGVGLANVRQRLNLLYGDRYSLRINEGANDYSVELNIPLS